MSIFLLNSFPFVDRSTKTYLFTTTGSWTVPADWNNDDNAIYCIGAGASGSTDATGKTSGAGGGGAMAKSVNVGLQPGSTVYFSIGAGGASVTGTGAAGKAGGDTWVNTISNAAPYNSAQGTLANGALATVDTGGLGGPASTSIGNSFTYSGGNGGAGSGSAYACPGGGSAASILGNGFRGGNTPTATRLGGGGGGGVSSNGATATTVVGGIGGNTYFGLVGGSGGANTSGSAGTSGGGGGGGGGNNTIVITGNGGPGGAGTEFTYNFLNNVAATGTCGSGGGGGGGGQDTGASGGKDAGGNGGLYGGGGGAGGSTATSGAGANGAVIIQYSPVASNPFKQSKVPKIIGYTAYPSRTGALAKPSPLPYPNNIRAGDLLLLFVMNRVITSASANGFSNLQIYKSGGNCELAVLNRVADGTETGNVSVTYSSDNKTVCVMLRIVNAESYQVANSGATTGNTQATPSATTTWESTIPTLWIPIMGIDNITDTPGVVFPYLPNQISEQGDLYGAADRWLNFCSYDGVGGTFNPGDYATGSGISGPWVTLTIAVKPPV